MLTVKHQASFLFREDAYREYCYSVDVYGSYQPASFIYLSFESLKDFCISKNLLLTPSYNDNEYKLHEWKYQRVSTSERYSIFNGVILRITSSKDLNYIDLLLKKGQNIIGLFPEEQLGLYYPSKSKDSLEKIKVLISDSYPDLKSYFLDKNANNPTSLWKKVKTQTKGKFIISTDNFLSDAYFFDGYKKSDSSTLEIMKLIDEFRIFNYPLVDFNLALNDLIWIHNEPIEFVFTLTNHSSLIDEFSFHIDVSNDFEPISSTEFVIRDMKPLSKRSVVIKLIPRVVGTFENFLEIVSETIEVSFNSIYSFEIKPSNYANNRDKLPLDDKSLSMLKKEYKKHKQNEAIDTVQKLMQVDISSALNKLRSLTEQILEELLLRKGFSLQRNLNANINLIKQHNLLSQKATGYSHLVRTVGNLGSHPSGEDLTEIDIRIVSYALMTILKEIQPLQNRMHRRQ